MSSLSSRHCEPCTGSTPKLVEGEIQSYLSQLEGWELHEDRAIARRFEFENFHETMAFVNAVAWIAHRENHHPDLVVGFRSCVVRYSTHDVAGLTETTSSVRPRSMPWCA
jgi:4a-hydroxytetrahydrobiopterin dehydratase